MPGSTVHCLVSAVAVVTFPGAMPDASVCANAGVPGPESWARSSSSSVDANYATPVSRPLVHVRVREEAAQLPGACPAVYSFSPAICPPEP